MWPGTNRTFRDRSSGGEWDVDRFNMQILQMVHAKYSREYRPFFAMLSTMYGNSKRGKEIREQIIWVNQVRSIIEACIFSGRVTGDQASALYELFDRIEERKQFFIDDVRNNQAMQQKMDKVTQSIGVSITDLNLTKEVLKTGVKQAKRKPKIDSGYRHSGAGERIRRIGEGMKIAALGPFSPIFDLVSDLTKTLASRMNRGRGVKESSAMSGIGMTGLSSPDFQAPRMPFEQGPFVSDPLFNFFNTKAYKAKWTKELLDRMKKAGQTISSHEGAAFGMKLLKYSAAAAALLVSIKNILSIMSVVKEAKEVGNKASVAGTELGKVIARRDAEVQQMGIEAVSEKRKRTPTQIIKESAKLENLRQQNLHDAAALREPIIAKVPGLRWITKKITGYERPKVQSVSELEKMYERKFNYTPPKIDTKRLDDIVKGASEEMKKMSKSVDKLSDSISKSNQVEIKPTGVGGLFDSADPLINQLSSGKLTLGGNR